MARKHYIKPTVPYAPSITARLGSAAGSANNYSDTEGGKFVKLAGESQYALCAAGDPIEGVITSVESATQDQWSIGGVCVKPQLLEVLFDGLQATPGTGTLAIGDYVVTGSVSAKGTALTSYPKVCKATMQPGITEAGAVGDVNNMLAVALFAYRVVSLGTAGTGAVGTAGVIQRVL